MWQELPASYGEAEEWCERHSQFAVGTLRSILATTMWKDTFCPAIRSVDSGTEHHERPENEMASALEAQKPLLKLKKQI